MVLYLDCANGISGDRLVAALLDLSGARPGARGPLDKIVRPVLKAAGIDPRLATVEAVRRDGVAALVFRVADAPGFASFDELIMSMYASSVAQPHADNVAAVADRLRAAEHAVHGEGDERRHEPCGVTTAVELIAAAALVHDLGPERIVASPPALGAMAAPSAGGEASASAAVVLQLLHGVPVADEHGGGEIEGGERAGDGADEDAVADEAVDEERGDNEAADGKGAHRRGAAGEATTPTGAALLAHFVDDFGAPPAGTVAGEGFGAARRGQPGRPDVLRTVLITPVEEGAAAGASPSVPREEAESSVAADTASIVADVPAAGAESRADATDVSAPDAEPPGDAVPAADAEPSPDDPPPSDAAAWFGVTPEPSAEPAADSEPSSDGGPAADSDPAADDEPSADSEPSSDSGPSADAGRLWAASPLFGAATASSAAVPDAEGTPVVDAAPWFEAPAVALPGGDDDTPDGDQPDAATADPFLIHADDLPDGQRDADEPGEEEDAEPDADDTSAADRPGEPDADGTSAADGPGEPDADGTSAADGPGETDAGDALAAGGPGAAAGDRPDEAEDDASGDAGDTPGEAAADVADDAGDAPVGDDAPHDDAPVGNDAPHDDAPVGDEPDGADDDQDTLVGDTHADAGRVQGAEAGLAPSDDAGGVPVVEAGVAPGDDAATASALPPTEHVVLETNIDDMSAELLAHAAEALREAGALDVWMTPALMKKGRPGTVLHVLAAAGEQERLAGIVFAETTSFGLRVMPVGRLYAEERRETVRIAGHDVGVRLGYAQGRLATVSPEYEDCRRAAVELGRPARVVYEAAQARARSRFSGH